MQKLILPVLLILTLRATAQQPELVLPVGHTKEVTIAQYSLDGKYIITASDDETAKIWESKTGRLLHTLEGHKHPIKSAYFSPDGKYIVTEAWVDSTRVWESLTGRLLYTLEGDINAFKSPQFSPDGKYLLAFISSPEGSLKILDSKTGELLHQFEGNNAQFSPNGKYIYLIYGEAEIWEIPTFKKVQSSQLSQPSIYLPEDNNFSPDGKYIVSEYWEDSTRIFETSTGELLSTLKGNSDLVKNAQFSPDAKKIVTVPEDGPAILWESSSGDLIRTLEGHSDIITSALFSPDSKYLVTVSEDGTAIIWESATGKKFLTLDGEDYRINSANFSPDVKHIITGTSDNTAKIFEIITGKLVRTLQGHTSYINDIEFTPDEKSLLITSYDLNPKIWEITSGKFLYGLERPTGLSNLATYSLDGKYILTTQWDDGIIKIWDSATGSIRHSFQVHKDGINIIRFSPDGKYIVTGSYDNIPRIWEIATGTLIHKLKGHSGFINSIWYSTDGKYIVTASRDMTAKIWESNTGRLLHTLEGNATFWPQANFSSDGKYVFTISSDSTITTWETNTGRPLYEFDGSFPQFSPDGKYIVTSSGSDTTKIWDNATGKLLHTFEGSYFNGEWWKINFSLDGKYFITQTSNSTFKIWEVLSGKLIHTLSTDSDETFWLDLYSPDGKYIITKSYYTVKIWDSNSGNLVNTIDFRRGTLISTNWQDSIIISHFNSTLTFWKLFSGEELLSLIPVDSTDWVVLHPSGLFDASPGAMEKMYFVQGLEVIEFGQLKERYYEPGLWGKVMGTHESELRDVKALGEEIPLYPEIYLSPVNQEGTFTIKLRNQGGGMGRVKVLINKKELTADARGTGFDPQADSALLQLNIGGDPRLIPGADNVVSVVAYNGENWVASRGVNLLYTAPSGDVTAPSAYIVCIGISDYTGEAIDLKYAAKDASDMAFALQTGAEKLFGKKNTHLWQLIAEKSGTTSIPPTKENILAVFDSIQRMSVTSDVLMVYISGHGLNLGGQEGDFYYLTKDAYTGNIDAYSDVGIRNATTISSTELVEKIKNIPALKQVLILDACHSGKAVENLMVMREVSSTSLRALDRMKDRTGMYIITGCAADAVSYETSRYGQGVLTYSLLEGIKGASLREDRFIDVNKLFSWASDRVPVLAEGVGGIQRPMVFSPAYARSFDVGELDTKEKEKIPLAKSKPMFLQSVFMELTEMDDIMGIEKIIDEKLRGMAGKGNDATIIFVEAREYPQAYRINGQYTVTGNAITLKANLRKGTELKTTISLEGTKENVEELADKIITEVLKFSN